MVGRRRQRTGNAYCSSIGTLLTAPPPLTSTAFHAFSFVPLRMWTEWRFGGNGGRGGVLALPVAGVKILKLPLLPPSTTNWPGDLQIVCMSHAHSSHGKTSAWCASYGLLLHLCEGKTLLVVSVAR